jgi:phosphoribosylformimino-5-aminoimidazole carboxamide ribotide isomerase
MKIIPAIDVLDGNIVRLTAGDYNQKTTYSVTLSEMLSEYRAQGIGHIHIIDLNGAKGDNSNEQFIFESVKNNPLQIQLGGGIRSVEKVKKLLDNGIFRVIIGTVSVTDNTFLEKLKDQVKLEQVILAIDVLDEVIMFNGWREAAPVKLYDFIQHSLGLGYNRFLCTDISKDGKLGGSSTALYRKILQKFTSLALIASGGVGSMKDVEELSDTGVESVVAGKAIYEKKISIQEVAEWNKWDREIGK